MQAGLLRGTCIYNVVYGGHCCPAGLAYNGRMKRLVLSVLGGFAIPFLYTIIVGPLSLYIKSETLNQLADYPVRWPIYILYRLVPLGSFPFRDQDSTALLIYIIGCDVILYTILIYFLLWGFLKRKSEAFDPPPNPPPSVQQ